MNWDGAPLLGLMWLKYLRKTCFGNFYEKDSSRFSCYLVAGSVLVLLGSVLRLNQRAITVPFTYQNFFAQLDC